MYAEDLDLCYRLTQRGWQVWYNADVTVLHYKGQSSRQRSALSNYHFYRTMRLFHDEHFKQRTFFLVNGLNLRHHRTVGRLGIPPRSAAPGRAARRSLGYADQGRHRIAMKRRADLLFGLLLAVSDLIMAAGAFYLPIGCALLLPSRARSASPIPGLCIDAVRPGHHLIVVYFFPACTTSSSPDPAWTSYTASLPRHRSASSSLSPSRRLCSSNSALELNYPRP